MNNRIQIPREWDMYYNNPAYFITYFGEIYFGTIWELQEYPDRFFIVENIKIKELNDLKPEEKTLEKYQQLGREIKDIKVISKIYDYDIGKNIELKVRNYGNKRYKKMFVFGAAASTFCVFGDKKEQFRKSQLNPPTGYEIFDEKYSSFINQYPGAKKSLPIFESKNRNIEECFEDEWGKFKSVYNPEIAIKHINIQFYLQTLFNAISKEVVEKHHRSNLYSLFLSKFQHYIAQNPQERISLVSFNYDTILDNFITQIYGYSFDSIDKYIDWENRNILLYKPHGSCDWGWKLKPKYSELNIAEHLYKNNIEPWEIYYKMIDEIDNVIATNSWGFEKIHDKHQRGRFTLNKNLIECIPEQSNNAYIPSLLIPYRDKDEFSFPYDHFNAMSHSIQEAEELYLIGWKGNEELFNKELKTMGHNLKKIIIVNPQADVVKDNLSKHLDLTKIEIIEIENFETFVLSHQDELLN